MAMDTVEVVVAVIGRAHGVRGEMVLIPRTDEPDRRLRQGAKLTAEDHSRSFVVATRRWISGRLVVGFAGVTDRNEAESLRGLVLTAQVGADERPEDSEEFYDRQLVGLEARLPDGRRVGQVSEVLHLPAQDVLSVSTEQGDRLVPFVAQLVPRVDLAAGLVELAEVPGLLDDEAIDDGSNQGDSRER